MIPKSTAPDRIRKNADLFGFAIDEEDMADDDRDYGPRRRGHLGYGRSYEGSMNDKGTCLKEL